MLTYQQEEMHQFYADAQPLFHNHWEAVEKPQDDTPPSLDLAKYNALNDIGAVHITSAREEQHRVVGYVVYVLSNHLHHASMELAEVSSYWLEPEFRRGRNGLELMMAAEVSLKALGVEKLISKSKIGTRIASLFAYMDFEPVEIVHAKRIA